LGKTSHHVSDGFAPYQKKKVQTNVGHISNFGRVSIKAHTQILGALINKPWSMNFFDISYLGGLFLSHTHVMPILAMALCFAKSIRCTNGTNISHHTLQRCKALSFRVKNFKVWALVSFESCWCGNCWLPWWWRMETTMQQIRSSNLPSRCFILDVIGGYYIVV
jgi:hypothetical protein